MDTSLMSAAALLERLKRLEPRHAQVLKMATLSRMTPQQGAAFFGIGEDSWFVLLWRAAQEYAQLDGAAVNAGEPLEQERVRGQALAALLAGQSSASDGAVERVAQTLTPLRVSGADLQRALAQLEEAELQRQDLPSARLFRALLLAAVAAVVVLLYLQGKTK